MSSISLCMICKNESELLSGCLESARKSVDEIIVVDTGSTDGTEEIAREFGARVISAPWTGFSSARNASINVATSEWVLVLDADEELIQDSPGQLRALADSGDADAFGLRIINCVELSEFVDLANSPKFYATRLFKRQGAFYRNPVHEDLQLPPGSRCFVAKGLDVLHYGYLQEIKIDRDKKERNTTLIWDWIENEPDNPMANYYLARDVLFRDKDSIDAIRHFEKALPGLTANGASTASADALMHLIQCYEGAGLNEKVLGIFEKGLVICPDFVEFRYFYGRSLLTNGKAREAIKQFSVCLTLNENDPRYYVSVPGAGTWRALELLGKTHFSLGEIDKAIVAGTLAKCLSEQDLAVPNPPFSFQLSSTAQTLITKIERNGAGAAHEAITYLLDD